MDVLRTTRDRVQQQLGRRESWCIDLWSTCPPLARLGGGRVATF